MMRPWEKARWVAALRSGDYEQGRSALNLNGRFCCLGVMCELSGFEKKPPREGHTYYPTVAYLPDDPETGPNDLYPSDLMLTTWGLSPQKMSALAAMNDEGKTFAEIADFIEADAEI